MKIPQLKFFERVWESFCSQKISQLPSPLSSPSFFLLLFTLFYVFCELTVALFQPVRTDDIFWHLKIGEILLQEKSFPTEEYLLFTQDPELTPLYHEWLFQIVVKSVENFGGLTALRFFLPLCVLCILWALLRFFRLFELRTENLLLATLLFLLFSYQRLIQLRPELFSMIFFFVMLHNLIQGQEKFSTRRIFLAVLVSMLWANTHSLCLIIFLFWSVWIGSAWIYSKIFKHSLSFDWKGQITGFFCSIFAMCLNPMGVGLFYFYFIGNARNPYTNVIDEWGHLSFFGPRDFLPLSSDVLMGSMLILVFWSVLVFIVLVLNLRNKKACGDGDEGGCFPRPFQKTLHFPNIAVRNDIQSFTHQRVTNSTLSVPTLFSLFPTLQRTTASDFFLGCAAILSLGLAAFAVRFFWLVPFPVLLLLKYFQNRPFFSSQRAQILCLFLLCVATVWHFRLPGTLNYRFPLENFSAREVFWKWDYDRSKYHGMAVDFLKDTGVQGNIFNPYFMGGFLSYRLNPKVRVFIDGRFEHYTEAVNRDFAEIKNVRPHFQELIRKYGIDLFFVPVEKDFTRMLLALRKIGWVVLYHDETAVIFAAKDVFKKLELKQALIRFYKTHRKTEVIPVDDADLFSDFTEKELRAQWAISAEQTQKKETDEIQKLTRESLENQLQHGFLEDALTFYNTVSDRIPLDDPFFSYFRAVFAQKNQLEWQFQKDKSGG